MNESPIWFIDYLRIMCLEFQVPALEHDGKVVGESMDLLYYLDEKFEGPKLAPTVSNLASILVLIFHLSCIQIHGMVANVNASRKRARNRQLQSF